MEASQLPLDAGGGPPIDAGGGPPHDAGGGWSEQFFRELGEQRLRAQELLSAQSDQIDCLEAGLAAQLQDLAAELEASQHAAAAEHSTSQRQAVMLSDQASELTRLKNDLSRREAAWEQAQHDAALSRQTHAAELRGKEDQLEQRARELQSAEVALRQAQRIQAINEEEILAEKEQLSRLRQRLEDQSLRLENQRESLAGEQARTKAQRRRIAREFKEQRADRLEEFTRRKTELQSLASRRHGDLATALETAQAEAADLRLQDAHLRKLLSERGAELHQQREENRRLHEAMHDQAQQFACLQAEIERLRGDRAERDSLAGDDQQQLSRLRAERDQLRTRLSDAEKRQSQADSDAERNKREDLQRRFELAVDEVRELKRKNAELEDQLASNSAGGSPRPAVKDAGRLDWESQKRRLLEALENEPDDDDDDARQSRLTVEGTIRITDEVVAQKDQEITDLKQLLDHQSTNLGSVAVGAAAIAELFNNDELIEQQRERLRNLELEWEQKLRQAEIDISLERAKIARDRAELEDKLAQVKQSERARSTGSATESPDNAPTAKPNRNRWLTRLGLKDQPGE
jgi:hypothetical protein